MRGPLPIALAALVVAAAAAGALLVGGDGPDLAVDDGGPDRPAGVADPFGGGGDEVEERLARLESRVGALAARLDILMAGSEGRRLAEPGLPADETAPGALLVADGSAVPHTDDAAADDEAADPESPEQRLARLQDELRRIEGEAPSNTPAELRREMRRIQDRLRATREEAELQRRLDTATEAMNLEVGERDQLEELLRAHRRGVDELADRARTFRRDSAFGLNPADKAVISQLQGDRKALDNRTLQSVRALVGPDRWKQFQRAEKAQRAKDRTLRRIADPW